MPQLTKIDIIKDTYNYYKEDPNGRRSFEDEQQMCMYNGSDGKRCAFARYCNEDEVEFMSEGEAASSNLEFLKPEYANVDNKDGEFWNAIQGFHDNDSHWDTKNNIITPAGEFFYQVLLEKYKD